MDSVKVVYSGTSLSYTSNLKLYNLVVIDYTDSLNFHLGKQEQIKQNKNNKDQSGNQWNWRQNLSRKLIKPKAGSLRVNKIVKPLTRLTEKKRRHKLLMLEMKKWP